MTYYIKAINFTNNTEIKGLENYFIKKDNNENNIIENLGKINIFVGENNSGKSSFLRKLQEIDSYFFEPKNEFQYDELNNIITNFNNSYMSIMNPFQSILYLNASDYTFSIQNFNKYIPSNKNLFGIENELEEKFKYIENKYNKKYNSSIIDHPDYKKYITEKEDTKNKLSKYVFNFNKIYIPVLRGLRNPIENNNEDIFSKRTKKDYQSIKSEIFTGLSLYEDIKKLLLGTHNERKIIRDFENFLSENFFNNEIITITPKYDDDVIYVRIGDNENTPDIPIYNLGDGIQSIIILTFPLFINQGKKMLFFIEEPEIYLHPSMQRILVQTFLDKRFEGFQYFIATHSNHFLDLTLDLEEEENTSISIFTCKKDKNENQKFIIENVSFEDNSPLKLLGVRNSSIFLSNCTIWVEGITDRLYLRHYFKIYQEYLKNANLQKKIFKEDLHFSFVEYSGGNITHWSFLDYDNEDPTINFKKVCNKVFLIADKDYSEDKGNKSEKELRHQKLEKFAQENNGFFQFKRLDCIEIENLIKPSIIIEVIKHYEEKNEDKIQEKKYTLENIDFKNRNIGTIIDEDILVKSNRSGKNPDTGRIEKGFYKYSEKSGTIKDKIDFCKKSINKTKDYSDLTEEVRNLCEDIYNFIEKHNK